MKKQITRTLAVAAVLALGATGLAACGSSTNVDESKGKVYYLNFKPESADQWKAIAETYTKETGVQVTVETAASNTYQQTLKSDMAKSEAPTLFQVNGPVGLAKWKDYCDDLTDTAIYKQLTDQGQALTSDDGSQILAVPYVQESYGIIYNKDLLNQYFDASWSSVKSIDDLNNFKALKTVATEIQSHKDDLGVEGGLHLRRLRLQLRLALQDTAGQPAAVLRVQGQRFHHHAAGHRQGHLSRQLQEHLRPVHQQLHHR